MVAYLGPSWLRSVEYKSNIVEKSKSRMVCIYSICRQPSESRSEVELNIEGEPRFAHRYVSAIFRKSTTPANIRD